MTSCRIVDLDAVIALEGADLAVRHKLAMADAIVLATASREGAELVTSDADLKGLPSVRFIPKKCPLNIAPCSSDDPRTG
jgi:predicted nucleic acid-binding protein